MDPTKTIRILIVDDHQMVRDGIKIMLDSRRSMIHFEVEEAENGAAMIQSVLKKNYL